MPLFYCRLASLDAISQVALKDEELTVHKEVECINK